MTQDMARRILERLVPDRYTLRWSSGMLPQPVRAVEETDAARHGPIFVAASAQDLRAAIDRRPHGRDRLHVMDSEACWCPVGPAREGPSALTIIKRPATEAEASRIWTYVRSRYSMGLRKRERLGLTALEIGAAVAGRRR